MGAMSGVEVLNEKRTLQKGCSHDVVVDLDAVWVKRGRIQLLRPNKAC